MTREQRLQLVSDLHGVTFQRKVFRQYSAEWDHDHCAACFAKFAAWEGPEILHDGYTTTADHWRGEEYEWICSRCFTDLQEEMNWKVVE